MRFATCMAILQQETTMKNLIHLSGLKWVHLTPKAMSNENGENEKEIKSC